MIAKREYISICWLGESHFIYLQSKIVTVNEEQYSSYKIHIVTQFILELTNNVKECVTVVVFCSLDPFNDLFQFSLFFTINILVSSHSFFLFLFYCVCLLFFFHRNVCLTKLHVFTSKSSSLKYYFKCKFAAKSFQLKN